MDSAKLNDWMQVVGIFAVVASLIFVGLQMRQSQEIAIAAQYQERYATGMAYFDGRLQNEILRRESGERYRKTWGLPNEFDESIMPEEFGAHILDARKVLLIYDNYHFQYEAGFLTDEAWNTYRNVWRSFVSAPMYQYMIAIVDLRPSFMELCEQLHDENQTETP